MSAASGHASGLWLRLANRLGGSPQRVWARLLLVSALAVNLSGCEWGVLDPKGPVGAADRTILIDSVAIMLAIVIPTILVTIAFAWWFRASNPRARYLPDFVYSGRVEMVVWSIPLLTILLLGGVTWIGAHELDPAKPLPSSNKPVPIQVVSLDWKWLFIYPEQKVAVLNRMIAPAGAPLQLSLTSASVLNVFFVPQLGSMIYTMNGMSVHLNLEADQPGVYHGLSAHFSGDGFSDMHFDVEAMSPADFANWARQSGASADVLDANTYQDLLKQSANLPPKVYRLGDDTLFEKIATQQTPSGLGPELGRPNPAVSPR